MQCIKVVKNGNAIAICQQNSNSYSIKIKFIFLWITLEQQKVLSKCMLSLA